MSFYSYVRNSLNLGVGTRDLAFQRSQSIPIDTVYGPRYNVHRSMAPQAPGFVKLNQQVVPVSLLGYNGLAIPTQRVLQQLVQMERG